MRDTGFIAGFYVFIFIHSLLHRERSLSPDAGLC